MHPAVCHTGMLALYSTHRPCACAWLATVRDTTFLVVHVLAHSAIREVAGSPAGQGAGRVTTCRHSAPHLAGPTRKFRESRIGEFSTSSFAVFSAVKSNKAEHPPAGAAFCFARQQRRLLQGWDAQGQCCRSTTWGTEYDKEHCTCRSGGAVSKQPLLSESDIRRLNPCRACASMKWSKLETFMKSLSPISPRKQYAIKACTESQCMMYKVQYTICNC